MKRGSGARDGHEHGFECKISLRRGRGCVNVRVAHAGVVVVCRVLREVAQVHALDVRPVADEHSITPIITLVNAPLARQVTRSLGLFDLEVPELRLQTVTELLG